MPKHYATNTTHTKEKTQLSTRPKQKQKKQKQQKQKKQKQHKETAQNLLPYTPSLPFHYPYTSIT